MSKFSSFVAVAALAVVSTSAQANFLANGGFETAGNTGGNPTGAAGWQGAAVAGQRVENAALARTGNAYLNLSVPQFNASVALQNSVEDGGLAPLTVGDALVLNFWAAGDVGPNGNFLFALRYLDGTGNILFNSGNQFVAGNGFPNLSQNYQLVTYTPGLVPAGAVAAFLEFSTATGPDATNVRIDDVSLTAIPEPASLSLLGLGGMLLGRRRRA